MVPPLPPLRAGLDIMPSPVPGRPGLLIRDPFRYADSTLIVPPPLVPCLACFDGERTELDLRELLVRSTGSLQVGDMLRHLVDTLSSGGFLEDEVSGRLREQRHSAFAEAEMREPSHAGSAYPAEPGPLRAVLSRQLDGTRADDVEPPPADDILAIAAPHVSPEGGWACYRAAYRALRPEHASRTFLILGTSHFGPPESFGLTRKPFLTPLGATRVAADLIERLAETGGPAARMEDYCHSVEHSIEFQVVFLQYLFGHDITILPILCGPFARSTEEGGPPEGDPHLARFLEALGEMAERERGRLLWVLGIDMAHMGRRYGDGLCARAGQAEMAVVARRDTQRIERLTEADAEGFWSLIQEEADPLKWCGSSPLYAFLRAARPTGGKLLRYQQWNIDEESVVSFAGLAFSRRSTPGPE